MQNNQLSRVKSIHCPLPTPANPTTEKASKWPALALTAGACAALALTAQAAATALAATAPAPATAPAGQSSQDDAGAQASAPTSDNSQDSDDTVLIRAKPWLFNRDTRYSHSLPEVDGATITVTKKTTVEKLDEQPTVIDNNQREIFDRLPGIVLAEQQNPTELNISYRGLGNPQESEYILLMQDGMPLELDWIGYPTTYYLPVPQTLSSVQMIRGGSGLLYGPEPQPVINFVSRAPSASELSGTTEQVGGDQGLFSSYNAVSGTIGNWDYLADYSHRQSDGQRVNGDYGLNAGDFQLGFRPDEHQKLTVAVHAYSLDSGLAGLMSAGQFNADRNQTTTPDDRLWTDRYSAVVTYENNFTPQDLFTQKLWSGYTDLITRSDTYTPELLGTAATISGQRFHYTGLDGRWLHRWGAGNALTVGYTAYYSRSPYAEFIDSNPLASRNDDSGVPFYLDERSTRYAALFAENVFRLSHRFHVVTSARLDHEELSSHEIYAPHPNLVDTSYIRNIPLFGIGVGNDFGVGNETYLNVSQGYRPLRYLDIASPFSNFSQANSPDPTHYVTYEGGVHGWPLRGFYYDVSLFQVNVKDRIESQQYSLTETVDVNTGNTRNRGLELETSYDLLRLSTSNPSSRHLTVFANVSLLDARFTSSIIPDQVGKTPAYAPDYVIKAGLTYRQDQRLRISLISDTVASQFFQDSNEAIGTTPARIPTYTLVDFAADYVIAGHLRLVGGIANLTDRHYYSRVFLFGGQLEPGRDRTFHAGLAYDF